VVLWHDREDCADEAGDACSCSENRGAGDRVLFMRHCGRAAAAGASRFRELRDFCLHVERKIVGDFGEGAGEEAEGCGDFGDAITMGVPGSGGKREQEFLGEILCDDGAVCSESGERADRTAELEDEGIIF